MQQFVPSTTTLACSNSSQCCKVSTPSFWEDSNNLIISKQDLIHQLKTKGTCSQIVNFEQYPLIKFESSYINIKQEPCPVAQVSASDRTNLKQYVVNLIDELNYPIHYSFTKTEICPNKLMDKNNFLEVNEFSEVPVGFGFSRQKFPEHIDSSNTMKESNRFADGLDLKNMENRSAPFAFNSEVLLNGTSSIIPLYSDNQSQSSFGLHSIRASNSIWQYPIAVHESLLSMPFPSLGVQLLRDHSTGHFFVLPPSSAGIDTIHPTIVWPSFQQSSETTQLPHIVFPSLQQTLATPFAPLQLTSSDFLSSTTLHQHTQTQTRLYTVSIPDNKKKIVIGPKPQQNAPIKEENKIEMKYENSEFVSNFDSKAACYSGKFIKSALQFSEEIKDLGFSRIQQDKSTQLNTPLCQTNTNISAVNDSGSQDKQTEITTTAISPSSEFVPSIGNDYFCYNETENVECTHCPFIFQTHDANQRDNKDCNIVTESVLNSDKESSSEHENIVNERECIHWGIDNCNDNMNESASSLPIIAQERQKNIKNDVNGITTHPIDFSGLELLSNISIEAIESKVLNLKKEIKKDESIDYYCREEVNNENNIYINEPLETLQSNNSTLGGLNLLCALAEQRIQEEDNKTGHQSPKLFKKPRIRQNKHKIIRRNKIKKKKIKYMKRKSENAEVIKEGIQKVFKQGKSKYNCCDDCRNEKWPSVAEIFKVMELKMMRKLASISNKYVEGKLEIKKSVSTYHGNNLNTNFHSNNYETQSLLISSNKVKARSPSPSRNQNESIQISTMTSLPENAVKDQNINFQENPTLFSKNCIKQTFYDMKAFKSVYNKAEESVKCISTVNIQPSVLQRRLSPQSRNVTFNKSNLLVDHISSNSNKGSARNNSIVLRLQKPKFNKINFSEFKKSREVLNDDMRLCKLIKNRLNMKKVQKHRLMKHKYMHTEEKKKIIDGHLRISDIHLREAKVRVLTAMGGLFYAGYLQPIEPPDVYAVTLDGERGNKPHIMCREEVLRDVILEISPASINEVPQGTRICAYWSPQYRCLYPGTTVETNEENKNGVFVSVEFDDGDSGKISLEDIRFLLSNYDVVEYNNNPLMSLRKKKTKKNEVTLKNNEFVPQMKTDNMIIERCKHHKIRKETCISFHYEHCKKHKPKCGDENCWPKKQKKKKKHRKRHRKRNILLNKQNYSDNNLNHNEKQNKTFVIQENSLKSHIRKTCKKILKENKSEKKLNSDIEVKCGKKVGKSNSKIAAFLPEKQLWQWSGNHFKKLGVKARTKKKYYKSIQRGDETLSIGDCAIFLSTDTDRPYVGKIQTMWETSSGNKVVRVRWFYHPEETTGCPRLRYFGGLFESSHEDENDVQTISHKCDVISLNDYIERFGDPRKYSIYNYNDAYYYVGFYDPVTHKIRLESNIPTSEEHQ